MRVKQRPSSRRVTLFPGAASNEDGTIAGAKPELIEALADLLLEALGEERDDQGEGHESEDLS